tara:strand:+ start:13969 stop:15111 length:1143 start_codon:yes stop_codon:yes gene_type:complete
MKSNFLKKGFEVELFTGNSNSHIGISDDIQKVFPEFVKEPDARNIEYITYPDSDYLELKEYLLAPRRKLRKFLEGKGLTILPSSSLCFKGSEKFQRSDLKNEYHNFIEEKYGTSIATASVHINIGINNISKLFAAVRLVRCEACLFLALSASSPFLYGLESGVHSQRWIQFPKTPAIVPIFRNHQEYAQWIEAKLEEGEMHNIRHFWSSVRPNGPVRPYQLDRLELRICDLISNTDLLVAVTALLELRILSLFRSPEELDPLKGSELNIAYLASLSDANDISVAKSSLDAVLKHWKDGREIICRDWIQSILDEVSELAKEMNIFHLLIPLYEVLKSGNQAIVWLELYKQGISIEKIMNNYSKIMKDEESFINRTQIAITR